MPKKKHPLEEFGFDTVENEPSEICLYAHGDISRVRNANHIRLEPRSETVGTAVGTGVGSAVGAAVGIGVGAAVGTFETLPSWPLDKFVGLQIQRICKVSC